MEKEAEEQGLGFEVENCLNVGLNIYSIDAVVSHNAINLSATLLHNEKDELIKTKPLMDCGAGGILIDQNFTQKHGIRLMELEQPLKA